MKPHFFFVLSVCILSVLSEQRLSDDVVPTHYDLKLTIIPRKYSLSGNVCIKLYCNKDVSEIKLHSQKKNGVLQLSDAMTLESLSDTDSNSKLTVTIKSYDEESDILTLSTSELKEKMEYKLCISFTGTMSPQNGYITYVTRYGPRLIVNQSRIYMIATNFQRQSAFPCFDEPNMKATFDIIFNVPYQFYKNLNLNKITFLSLDAERLSKGTWFPYGVIDTYSVKREVPPSQISFMVSTIPYAYATCKFHEQLSTTFEFLGDWEPGDIRVYARAARAVCDLKVEHVFTDQYPKTIRFIIQPNYVKSISWKVGLVVISQKEIKGPSKDQREYNILIRLTSQLFGGMITPDSWESNWLFTALAKYCAYLQMEKQPFLINVPSLMMTMPSRVLNMNMNIFHDSHNTDVFQEEIVGTNKGMEVYLLFTDYLNKDNLSKKRCSFQQYKVVGNTSLMMLQLIHSVLGDRFVPALKGFVEQYQYSKHSAGPNQLWQAFDKESTGGDNKWSTVMEQWTTQPGYPLVTVSALKRGKFAVTQEHFIGSYEKKMQKNSDKLCWMIPLSYSLFDTKTSVMRDFEVSKTGNWLTCEGNKKITIDTGATEEELVLFNTGYKSMNRVKYDDKTLEKIIKTLSTSRLSIEPVARAQIVHDALSLAWLGYQDYKYVFSLLEFMEYEEDDIVWKAFFSGAFHLNEILKASRETYEEFQAFVKYILSDTYMKKYKDRNHIRKNVEIKYSYTTLPLDDLFHDWACNVARIEMCRNRALEVFQQLWMVDFNTFFFKQFKQVDYHTLIICFSLTSNTIQVYY